MFDESGIEYSPHVFPRSQKGCIADIRARVQSGIVGGRICVLGAEVVIEGNELRGAWAGRGDELCVAFCASENSVYRIENAQLVLFAGRGGRRRRAGTRIRLHFDLNLGCEIDRVMSAIVNDSPNEEEASHVDREEHDEKEEGERESGFNE